MSNNIIIESYFQGGGGVNEPTPKKKKYKSDKAIVNKSRFKEPLYNNYDLYEVEGVDGSAKHGPGSGFYQSMQEFKSVKDFLKNRRKRNKDKYKAKDSYIEDDGKITSKSDKIARRMLILSEIVKLGIDFSLDNQIDSFPTTYDSGAYGNSVQIGGVLDGLTYPDFEGKTQDQLNYGRDYTADIDYINNLQDIFDKMLNPEEPDLYGLPDGIDNNEDLENVSEQNNYYGILDSNNEPIRKTII